MYIYVYTYVSNIYRRDMGLGTICSFLLPHPMGTTSFVFNFVNALCV